MCRRSLLRTVEVHRSQLPRSPRRKQGSRPTGDRGDHALFWDIAERAGMETGSGPVPYHYVRLANGDRENEGILVVGGEDHKSGQADDGEARFDRLEDWARAQWPMVK